MTTRHGREHAGRCRNCKRCRSKQRRRSASSEAVRRPGRHDRARCACATTSTAPTRSRATSTTPRLARTADDALNSVVQQVQHVRDLTVQAQNGTLGSTELDRDRRRHGRHPFVAARPRQQQVRQPAVFAGTATGSRIRRERQLRRAFGHHRAHRRHRHPGADQRQRRRGVRYGWQRPVRHNRQLSADIRAQPAAIATDHQRSTRTPRPSSTSSVRSVPASNAFTTMKNRNDSSATSLKQGSPTSKTWTCRRPDGHADAASGLPGGTAHHRQSHPAVPG